MCSVSSEVGTEGGVGEYDSLDDLSQIPSAYRPKFFEGGLWAWIMLGLIIAGFVAAAATGLI